MIDFINSTFPFAEALKGQTMHINMMCRDSGRTATSPPCPFVFLSALSYSNAVFLAKYPDFVQQLRKLFGYISHIKTTLEQHLNGKKVNFPDPLRNEARRLAESVRIDANSLLELEHPIADVILDIFKRKVKPGAEISDIIENITQLCERVLVILSGGYNQEKATAIEHKRALSEQVGSLLIWVCDLGELSKKAKEHSWSSRSTHMGDFGVSTALKQHQLEELLKNRSIGMQTDKNCIFCNIKMTYIVNDEP